MKYFTTCFLAAYLFFIPNFMKGQVIKTADSVIAPHQIIKVTFDSFPGNQQDWIALAIKGSGTYVQFLYLNGQKKGSLEFSGQTYGEYELRGYYNNENQIRKTVNFRIGNKDLVTKITPTQAVVKPNDSIRMTFSGFPGNDMDYISIAQPGSSPGSYLEYKFLNKMQSGTLALSGRAFGVYELRGYFNNETVIRFQTQVVVGEQTLVITPDKPVFNSNEIIKLNYSGFPGNPQDWISIAKTGSPPTSYINYKYLNAVKSGSLTLDPVPDGEYELRGYVNNEYIVRVTAPIRVGNTIAAIQTPGILNIQGVLTTAAGQVVPNGSYSILFRLYNAGQGGSAVWEENQTNVEVQSGVFSVVLGKIKPFNIAFDKPYFLGIQFGAEAEMTPRVELTSTPYSLMAKSVENNSISTDKIQPNAVTLDKIAAPIVSSINGVSNDGGNINILAGANIAIVNDDLTKSITISAVNPGGGTGGISRINPGNAISVNGQDGPTATISVAPNSITTSEIQNNAVTADKIAPNILSSLSGVSNDGGNINLVAGNNISIVPNDATKTITISAAGGGTGTGSISQLTEGNGIGIQNPFGPNTTIGLKPNILLGPSGSLHILNQSSAAVAGISTSNQGGFLTLSNAQGTQTFGVSNFIDLQPSLYLNSRLGRQVLELKANEFSDGEINIKSVLTNTALRLTTNENAGGLVNVFNQNGNIGALLTTTPAGAGLLTINSLANRRVLDISHNVNGGGFLALFNEVGTESIRLSTNQARSGLISLRNKFGNEAVYTDADDLGDGGIFIRSGENLPALELSVNTDNGGGFIGLRNGDGNGVVSISSYDDRQPYVKLFNRLGSKVGEFSANEFSDGELTLGSVLENITLQLTANDDASGLINVFNSNGLITSRLTNTTDGNGRLTLNSVDNNRVLDLETNTAGGGVLHLYNVEGTEALRLTTFETYGGSVRVSNRAGLVAARLNATTIGDGNLSIFNKNEQEAAYLSVNNNDGGFLGIRNGENTEVAKLSTLSNSQPRLLLSNRLGGPVADLRANDFSDGELQLFGVLNNPTLRLTANDGGGGLINVFNSSNKIAAVLTDDGGGYFGLFNTDETEMIQLGMREDRNARIRVNNRLGKPVADLMSNEFSDGELILGSSINNFTVRLTANDDAGGLINVFNKSGKAAAELTEYDGYGHLDIYNPEGNHIAELGDFNNAGSLIISNSTKNIAAVYADSTSGFGTFGIYSNDEKSSVADLTKDANDNGFLALYHGNLVPPIVTVGGNAKSEGELKLFNAKGLNTSLLGHNEFGDGHIELKNNLGNLAGLFEAFKDGGSLTVTDGKPGTNHRGVLGNGLNGGKLSLFNNQTKLVSVISVGDNGEGLWQIVSKQDLTKNRLVMGGDNAGTGYLRMYNSLNNNTSFLGHDVLGNGSIELRSNLGTLGGFITAYTDGGRLAITDGSAANNYRGLLENVLNGGKFSIYNKTNIPVDDITVANNGEGLIRIAARPDFSKSRLELGGDDAGAGFVRMFNGGLKKTGELITNGAGGELNIFNSNGINTARLGHLSNGSGALEVGTPNGNKVVRVTSSDGAGFIGVDNIDNQEVVRITANTGKGGGIAIRNDKVIDMIKLTQDQSYGVALFYNPTGGLLTTITRNSAGGSFIGTLDQNGKDALWLTTGTSGGGKVTMFNALGKVASNLATDGSNNGLFTVHGSAGNEVAKIETTASGTGKISIKNTSGINLAGFTNHPTTGGGYVYANDASGKELARMTTNQAGTNGRISIDNASGNNLAGISGNTTTGGGILFANDPTGNQIAYMTNNASGSGEIGIASKTGTILAGLTIGNASGGGYLYANHSNGKDVARMSSLSGGSGFMSVDNSLAKTVSFLTTNTLNGGWVSVANNAGVDRALITAASTGGYFQANNNSNTPVVDMGVTTSNHGYMETSNSSGAVITTMSHNSSSEGFIGAYNAAGQERAYLLGTKDGGQVGLNDNNGRRGVFLNGQGFLTLTDADGSWFTASHFGTGFSIGIVDKFSHPRAEIKEGVMLAKGPNGIEHSFMSTTNGSNLGYIGVCNSNLVGNPVKAGMYTNGSNQGVLFADIKNFKMDYPGKPDKQIWYGSLEGPELAAYIRGTAKLINGKASVSFTDHYQQVANSSTMTVILTPLSGKSKGLAVVKKASTGFEVEELLEGNGSYEFDWEVKCVRKGYEDFEPVRNKSDEPKPFTTNTNFPQVLESRSNEKIQIDPIVKEQVTRQQ